MQAQSAGAMPYFKVYLYNPNLWALVFILAWTAEHTTRCGDAYR